MLAAALAGRPIDEPPRLETGGDPDDEQTGGAPAPSASTEDPAAAAAAPSASPRTNLIQRRIRPEHDNLLQCFDRIFSARCADLQLKKSDLGRQRFKDALHRATSAERLELRSSGIGPAAAAELVRAIVLSRQQPWMLDLGSNQVGDVGATHVAALLEHTSTLVWLALELEWYLDDWRRGARARAADQPLAHSARSFVGEQRGQAQRHWPTRRRNTRRRALHMLSTVRHGRSRRRRGIDSRPAYSRAARPRMRPVLRTAPRRDATCHRVWPARWAQEPQQATRSRRRRRCCPSPTSSRGRPIGGGRLRCWEPAPQPRTTAVLPGGVTDPSSSAFSASSSAAAVDAALDSFLTGAAAHSQAPAASAEAVVALADALRLNPTLQILRLGGNNLGPDGAALLAAPLSEEGCAICELSLPQNSLGAEGAEALAPVAASSARLRVLDVSLNNLGDRGVKALAAALIDSTPPAQRAPLLLPPSDVASCLCGLVELNLSQNRLTGECADALARGLLTRPHLATLRLQKNELGDEGGIHLARALSEGCGVSDLQLQDNGIGDEGACAIGEAMRLLACKLCRLDLSQNQIGNAGGVAVAVGLATPTSTVHTCRLGWNKLGESAGIAFGSALASNCPRLRGLVLQQNSLAARADALVAGAEDPSVRYNAGARGERAAVRPLAQD